jgi:hypothetical protein
MATAALDTSRTAATFLRNEPNFSLERNLSLEPPCKLAGIEFIDENSGGPGVRHRKPPKHKR